MLPCEILHHIFCYVPFTQQIELCYVSRAWKIFLIKAVQHEMSNILIYAKVQNDRKIFIDYVLKLITHRGTFHAAVIIIKYHKALSNDSKYSNQVKKIFGLDTPPFTQVVAELTCFKSN